MRKREEDQQQRGVWVFPWIKVGESVSGFFFFFLNFNKAIKKKKSKFNRRAGLKD